MDPILYWNAVALEAERTTHTTQAPEEAGARGPAGASRAAAMVHLAMHDAYFGLNPDCAPYLGHALPKAPAGADTGSAVAAAAHAVLSALYPAQRAYFDAQHVAAGLPGGSKGDAGHTFGQAVASALLALRAGDPDLTESGHASSGAPQHHRPDPDNPAQGYYAPFYGHRSHLFAATARYQIDAPPQPGSALYDQAIRQVRAKGIAPQLTGTLPQELLPARTAAETVTGVFWSYDGTSGLGTPVRLYNQLTRDVATARGNDTAANARLFALVNAALADAGILCWTEKYRHDLWRPVVAIRATAQQAAAGDGCGAQDLGGDPGWLPMGAQASNSTGKKNFTPPFPSYPSGHATFGSAAFQTIRHFYRQGNRGPDTLAEGLEFVSDELNGTTTDNNGAVRPRIPRTFPGGLWQMIEENGRSRVYLGVHWVYDAFAIDDADQVDLGQNIGGVPLGLAIADDIAAHGLKASAAAGPAGS